MLCEARVCDPVVLNHICFKRGCYIAQFYDVQTENYVVINDKWSCVKINEAVNY